MKNCAQIAKPLAEFTKSVPFEWTEKQQSAFSRLKNAVITAPILHTFDPNYPVYVTSDASKMLLGRAWNKSFRTVTTQLLSRLEHSTMLKVGTQHMN